MPRFVLLRHELSADQARESHWDLMLEHDDALWTWALASLPLLWSEQLGLAGKGHGATQCRRVATRPNSLSGGAGAADTTATRLADHRLAYLDFEGPINGGRGHVTRCDAGSYRLVAEGEDEIVVEMSGTRLNGDVILNRKSSQTWQLSTPS